MPSLGRLIMMILLLFLAIVEYLIYIFCLRPCWGKTYLFFFYIYLWVRGPIVWHVAPGLGNSFSCFDRFFGQTILLSIAAKIANVSTYMKIQLKLRFETGLANLSHCLKAKFKHAK